MDTRGRQVSRNSASKRRMTSLERFELNQMKAAGIIKPSDFAEELVDDDPLLPLSDKNGSLLESGGSVERHYDVRIVQERPLFLQQENQEALIESALEIVKNPEGSLQRAAMFAAEQAKLRRDKGIKPKSASGDSMDSKKTTASLSSALIGIVPESIATDDIGDIDEECSDPRRKPYNDRSSRTNESNMKKPISSSIREQRESLPVFQYRDQLLEAIHNNTALVIVGDTGCGKTTQLPQYLYESGYSKYGKIGCTQPRRVAATSVAKRVSQEMAVRLGDEVGYIIRFEDKTSSKTRIKYMTDGMLLRECLVDPDLSAYSLVMLDEAHERTLATDVLFGLLKQTLERRNKKPKKINGTHDLSSQKSQYNDISFRVIVTSATMEAEKFRTYFHNAPIFNIPGRTFPVEIMFAKDPEPDYLEAALLTVLQIHLSEPPGDILVFLTGQEEIDTACDILKNRMEALGSDVPDLWILPVYAALPSDQQALIFQPTPPGSRKVILATNIAETSLTVDGIIYVVDPGFVKQKVFNPRLGMDTLLVKPISQAQAKQRAGRAGRTAPGTCYRLYTEKAFYNELSVNTTPEIQRTNLATIVLTLKAMGLEDLLNFEWMDAPPKPSLFAALHYLYIMGALNTQGNLTDLGFRMAQFPLEPPLSKCLLTSVSLDCVAPMLTIVAMLSIPSPFYRPKEKADQADRMRKEFETREGDHLMLLNVFEEWYSQFKGKGQHHSTLSNDRDELSYTNVHSWCHRYFLQHRLLLRALDIRQQLSRMLKETPESMRNSRGGAAESLLFRNQDPMDSSTQFLQRSLGLPWSIRVCIALTSGFFMHIAKKSHDATASQGDFAPYLTLHDNTAVHIHPSSSLSKQRPDWLLYHELVLTSREYIRTLTSIDPRWLPLLAPSSFQLAAPQIQQKLQPLHNRFEKPDEWRLSKRTRAPNRPSQAF